jgi:Fe-S-cluster containining protein
MNCSNCQAYIFEKLQCHRYPRVEEKKSGDWCLEFKAKEVIVCPVVEEKASEARVEEKAVVSEPEIIIPEVKRGWPKGKPRK